MLELKRGHLFRRDRAELRGGVRRCLGMAFALVEMKIVLATLAPSEEMPVVVEGRAA